MIHFFNFFVYKFFFICIDNIELFKYISLYFCIDNNNTKNYIYIYVWFLKCLVFFNFHYL
jgi:hypothetical protein